MANYTCLDCIHYCPKQSSVKFVNNHFEEIVIEHHCSKNNEVFKKFWEENKSKLRKDIVMDLECFELPEHLKCLEKMIQLAKEIIKIQESHEKS